MQYRNIAMPLKLRLSKHSPEPRALQLRAQLFEFIQREGLREGSRLPSERELAERFHLNVNTVSKAYRMLVGEGYLSRSVGRGTFLCTACLKGTIALIRVHDRYSPGSLFGRLLVEGLAAWLTKQGWRHEFIDVAPGGEADLMKNHRFLEGIRRSSYSAVAMNAVGLPQGAFERLSQARIPSLILDTREPLAFCDEYLHVDYADFFRRAVDDLRAHGARRPVCFGMSRVLEGGRVTPAIHYLAGLLLKAGIPFDESRGLAADHTDQGPGDYGRIRRFLAEAGGFDAIVCDNDVTGGLVQLALLADRHEVAAIRFITHANRGVSGFFAVPVKPLFVDLDAVVRLAGERIVGLATHGPHRAPCGVPVGFAEE
jgi:DNA-binding LacI/PurR family transcriptional regulator